MESMEAEEYEYLVDVAGAEAFRNAMDRQGMFFTSKDQRPGVIRFTSEKLLDLKRLLSVGIIRSYKISKVKKMREVIEERRWSPMKTFSEGESGTAAKELEGPSLGDQLK